MRPLVAIGVRPCNWQLGSGVGMDDSGCSHGKDGRMRRLLTHVTTGKTVEALMLVAAVGMGTGCTSVVH